MIDGLKKPFVGVPIGDPAGVGPEIAVKALASGEVYETARPLLIGDRDAVERAIGLCGAKKGSGERPELREIASPGEGTYGPAVVNLINVKNLDIGALSTGKVQAMCGRAAYEYIEAAVSLAMNGAIDAIATAPINKESLREAGVPYIGHTEILAGLAGAGDPLTMFEVRDLRVFFFSRHISLSEAVSLVTKERLLPFILRCADAMKKIGLGGKSLAVAGLNPHCGEHGLFGHEEVREIVPAVEEARRRGCSVEGPIGADSVFHLGLCGRFGAVVSLYHDQGHIAAKTFDFDRTISVTLGLPFVRTSVDHGTAFDIAGTGAAREVSMVEAIKSAARYAPHFARGGRSAPGSQR